MGASGDEEEAAAMRKPLGRGLDALIERTTPAPAPPAPAPLQSNGILLAPASRIIAGPFQPRQYFDSERLQELTRAIQSQGIIEPLVVRPARQNGGSDGPLFELIAGERRLRAARAAGLDEVPVVVRTLDDRAALEMSLVENLVREDLTAVEEARALSRLAQDFKLTHDEIAGRIGKSRPYVSNAIRLLDLAPEVLEMIARGDLTAGQARPLLALASPEAQLAEARKIVEGRISARGAEEIASKHRRRKRPRAGANGDANLAALCESLQRAFKRKVRIARRRGKQPGRVEIDYYDDNDLNALATMLLQTARGAHTHA
jgi:ParB family chromosome partitioning protein